MYISRSYTYTASHGRAYIRTSLRTVPVCFAALAHRRKFVKLRAAWLFCKLEGLPDWIRVREAGREREREREAAFNSWHLTPGKNDLERRTELIYGSAVSGISSSKVDNLWRPQLFKNDTVILCSDMRGDWDNFFSEMCARLSHSRLMLGSIHFFQSVSLFLEYTLSLMKFILTTLVRFLLKIWGTRINIFHQYCNF